MVCIPQIELPRCSGWAGRALHSEGQLLAVEERMVATVKAYYKKIDEALVAEATRHYKVFYRAIGLKPHRVSYYGNAQRASVSASSNDVVIRIMGVPGLEGQFNQAVDRTVEALATQPPLLLAA